MNIITKKKDIFESISKYLNITIKGKFLITAFPNKHSSTVFDKDELYSI